MASCGIERDTRKGMPLMTASIHDPGGPFPMDSPSDLPDEAITWFARLSSGDMTAQEHVAFQSWRGRSSAHERAFQDICTLWDKPELAEAAGILVRNPPRARRSRIGLHGTHMAAAAVVLLAVTAVMYLMDVPLRLQADYVTAVGERHTLTLADQSTVILNTNSAVVAGYDPDRRRVRLLKGEALFQVRPDKTRPFLVEHGGVVTRAVGTAFVVREQADHVQVSVIEGVVSVEPNTPGPAPVTVTAGHRAVVATDGTITLQSLNTEVALAWLHGRLVFENTPFAEVLEEVSRYHAGYVGIWNPALAGLSVSGTYNLSNPANIFATLTKTLPVHMTRLSDRFVVFR